MIVGGRVKVVEWENTGVGARVKAVEWKNMSVGARVVPLDGELGGGEFWGGCLGVVVEFGAGVGVDVGDDGGAFADVGDALVLVEESGEVAVAELGVGVVFGVVEAEDAGDEGEHVFLAFGVHDADVVPGGGAFGDDGDGGAVVDEEVGGALDEAGEGECLEAVFPVALPADEECFDGEEFVFVEEAGDGGGAVGEECFDEFGADVVLLVAGFEAVDVALGDVVDAGDVAVELLVDCAEADAGSFADVFVFFPRLLDDPDVAVEGDRVEGLLGEDGIPYVGGDIVDGLGCHDATTGRENVGLD